jgi:hypothetical protein
MPSRIWYAVAAAVLVAGMAGMGWALWSGLSGIQDMIVRFVVPGVGEVMLTETGTYTIFHEKESAIDGRIYSAPTIGGLTVTVTEETGGTSVPIPVKTPGMRQSYTVGSHSGESMLAFDVARPGRYRVVGAYDSGRTEPKTVLSVDRGFFGRVRRALLLGFGSMLVGAVAAPAIGFTTYFRRRQMLRALARAQAAF